MPKNVIAFRRKALEDIEGIVRYIAADSPRAAQAFREALEQACSVLAEMPDMGMHRNFGHPRLTDIRLWPLRQFEKYLLVYRTQGETLDIIRVVHGARDLPALFGDSSD